MDTEVFGDPASCQQAATAAGTVATGLETARGKLDTATTLAGSWQGQAGAAFETRVATTGRDLVDVAALVTKLQTSLTDFAGELTVVKSRMAQAREVAAAGGVAVAGSLITLPDPPQAASQAQIDVWDKKVAAWDQAVGIVDGARTKETEAHSYLAEGLAAASGDGFLENLMQRLGFLPPDNADAVGTSGWLFGLAGLGFGGGVGYLVNGRYGSFQPRVNGRFGSAAGMSFWQRMQAAGRSDSWHAKPYAAQTRNGWARAGTWASRAGTVVTAGTAAWDQWQADADDPSLGDVERGARAATQGATTAAGAWAGAQGGAWVGGAIGTALFPGVGTVVGGVVGGVIGGAIGGLAGSEVGDALVDPIGDAADATADWVGDTAGDLADGAGEAWDDVGDTLSFWD